MSLLATKFLYILIYRDRASTRTLFLLFDPANNLVASTTQLIFRRSNISPTSRALLLPGWKDMHPHLATLDVNFLSVGPRRVLR